MSKGILLFAQNNDHDDYIKQACFAAISTKKTNPCENLSVITNDAIPSKYRRYFDQVICDKATDHASNEEWKISNRVKLYELSPYDHTLVLDTDVLVLSDISHWWKKLKKYEVYFTTSPVTYRGERLTSDFYRRSFIENSLPCVYSGLHYFSKSTFAKEFYKWLELVTVNWEKFYSQHLKYRVPRYPSIDMSAAIVIEILDCEKQVTNPLLSYPTFVHMKANTQNWKNQATSWQDFVQPYLDDNFELKIGNYKQSGIFHYSENSFVSNYLETRFTEMFNERYL